MKYIFSVRSDIDEDYQVHLRIDSFYHVKSYDLFEDDSVNPAGRYYDMVALAGEDAANKRYPNLQKQINQDTNAINGMSIRARMNNCNLHVVITDTEIDIEDMGALIKMKSEDGTLSEFLKESRL